MTRRVCDELTGVTETDCGLNVARGFQTEAEDVLAHALPALEAARLALDDLDKNDVTEIRSFAKPPKPVQTVCECIVVLKGIKEVSWKSAKAMMSEASFLRSLKEMDVDNITQKQVRCRLISRGASAFSKLGRSNSLVWVIVHNKIWMVYPVSCTVEVAR